MTVDTPKSMALREAFDKVCKDAQVYHGWGPASAYFETPPDSQGTVKQFTYVAFRQGIAHEEGAEVPGDPDWEPLSLRVVMCFKQWLLPRRSLLWRTQPEVEQDAQLRWHVYYRCVQIESGAKSIPITWHF